MILLGIPKEEFLWCQDYESTASGVKGTVPNSAQLIPSGMMLGSTGHGDPRNRVYAAVFVSYIKTVLSYFSTMVANDCL